MSEPRTTAADAVPEVSAAYRTALALFGGREDISGIDIGYRVDDHGERTEELAVRIHYSGQSLGPGFKLADAFLRAADGVPLVVLPAAYSPHEASTSDVPETAGLPPRRRRVDPLRPGVSISHWRTTTGTLGLIVYDLFSGRPCLLSNHHVLVPAPSERADESVVQPAADDGGTAPLHTVAHVVRSMLDADGDAAIAQLTGSRGIDQAQWESDVVVRTVRDPALGDVVEKSGVRTGVTRGVVDGIGRYYVSPTNPGGMDGFRVVAIASSGAARDDTLVARGDSGAVWYRLSDQAGLGLHVGGEVTDPEPLGRSAVACYLSRVTRRLGVSVIPLETMYESEQRAPTGPARGAPRPPIGNRV
jgi:endonuclease G, mitochondrial